MSIDLSMFMDENGNISSDKVELVKGAIEKHVSGLNDSKNAILTEKKKLQERMKLYEDIDPEEYKKIKSEYEQLSTKIAEGENDATKIKNALTSKYEKELEEYKKQVNEYKTKYQQKIIDETLTAELEKVGVTNPAYKKSVKALLKNEIDIKDDTVLLGEKTVDQYIKEWSETEEAKAFITAKENAGGGFKTPGSSSNEDVSKMTVAEKAAFIEKYGAEAYRKKAGF